MLMPDGTHAKRNRRLRLPAVSATEGELAPLPDYFVDAQVLSPEDHVVMQATSRTRRQLDFEDDQPAPRSPSTASRASIGKLMRSAARAAQPTGRMR